MAFSRRSTSQEFLVAKLLENPKSTNSPGIPDFCRNPLRFDFRAAF
jgi:hypothetical protein